MSLPEQYRKLLIEYDKVLNLSKTILDELRKGGEVKSLVFLLDKKKMTGEAIARLTKEINLIEVRSYPDANLKTLAEVKGLLKLISEKARLLQEVEEKVQNFLKKKDPGWK